MRVEAEDRVVIPERHGIYQRERTIAAIANPP